jgi:hypothetical protein
MSNTTPNPLARLVLEAQQIISKAAQPGANTAAAIQHLAGLLCTPVVHDAVLEVLGVDGFHAAAASLA